LGLDVRSPSFLKGNSSEVGESRDPIYELVLEIEWRRRYHSWISNELISKRGRIREQLSSVRGLKGYGDSNFVELMDSFLSASEFHPRLLEL
jgi:hypothetical protein